MSTVAIVDYGMCNLDSIRRAVEECGRQPLVTDRATDLAQAERIILPGVGAFPDAMRNIRERGLDVVLEEQVCREGVPFLGICLGMQLMAERGWENEETTGLGWIEGEVERLGPTSPDERIPHVGWNEVRPVQAHPLFPPLEAVQDFYFVHSYHLRPRRPGDVVARTPYCGGFVSAVGRDNMVGVQFHPEKSQKAGFAFLRRFLTW